MICCNAWFCLVSGRFSWVFHSVWRRDHEKRRPSVQAGRRAGEKRARPKVWAEETGAAQADPQPRIEAHRQGRREEWAGDSFRGHQRHPKVVSERERVGPSFQRWDELVAVPRAEASGGIQGCVGGRARRHALCEGDERHHDGLSAMQGETPSAGPRR